MARLNSSNTFSKLSLACLVRQIEKRIQGEPTKRESKRFHSTLVEQTTLAAHDAVDTAEEVAMAMKVVAKMPVQPCLGWHQRLVPARIQRGTLLPSAQAIRAMMVICSAFQWK